APTFPRPLLPRGRRRLRRRARGRRHRPADLPLRSSQGPRPGHRRPRGLRPRRQSTRRPHQHRDPPRAPPTHPGRRDRLMAALPLIIPGLGTPWYKGVYGSFAWPRAARRVWEFFGPALARGVTTLTATDREIARACGIRRRTVQKGLRQLEDL